MSPLPLSRERRGPSEAWEVRVFFSLADPKKKKWHEAEKSLLDAIEAELARKRLAKAG